MSILEALKTNLGAPAGINITIHTGGKQDYLEKLIRLLLTKLSNDKNELKELIKKSGPSSEPMG